MLVTLTVSACTFIKPDGLIVISPQELNAVIQKADIFLVDVHVPEQRHIKGTDLFIPYDEIADHLEKFPKDKQTPIYLYCEGGPMANSAARVLMNEGYKKVYNLEGGADAWHEAGYEFQ